MSVKIKDLKQVETEKGTPINFDAESFMAIKGDKGSFFEGEVKVVHKVHGEKLVKAKKATEVKATLVKEENLNRSSKDRPKN